MSTRSLTKNRPILELFGFLAISLVKFAFCLIIKVIRIFLE